MRTRRPPIAPMTLAAVALALAIAGCGEVTNTIKPNPGSANQVTVLISGKPNGFYVGLYEAQALGYFKQTDMHVDIEVPKAGEDVLQMVHEGKALVGITSTPSVLLHRNENEPLVGIAAIVHAPLTSIRIAVPRRASGGSGLTTTTGAATTTVTAATVTTTTGTTTSAAGATTTTTISEADSSLWPAQMQKLLGERTAPDYDGLVIVARKGTIVDHAGLLRRFVQAVARGYRAARSNPTGAVQNLITEVPALASSRALQLATVNAAIPYFFPSGLKIWGYQRQAEWNTLGTWMTNHHLISNPNTITDASTNELLAGEGV